MRPTHSLRPERRVRVAAGALLVTIPLSTAALVLPAAAGAAAQTATAAQNATVMPAHVRAHRVGYDRPVVLTGSLGSAEAGHRLALEYLPTGGAAWQRLTTTTVTAAGRYRLSARLRRTGSVRVVDLSTSSTGAVASASSASTQPQRVAVAAGLRVGGGARPSFGGAAITVRGRMLPGLGGRIVRLQAGDGHGWRTVASAATRRGGAFTLRYSPHGATRGLRVRFAGDRENAGASAPAGTVASLFATEASWYYDGAQTGCGFHATYGVANKSLPCGTRVRFVFGGRSVVATVDDRGPYVGGRTWDLNQNTAAALGFGGVGTVWASY